MGGHSIWHAPNVDDGGNQYRWFLKVDFKIDFFFEMLLKNRKFVQKPEFCSKIKILVKNKNLFKNKNFGEKSKF